MQEYGVNDSNGQSLFAVIIVLVYTFVIPALVLWFDKKRYVDEVEKEQKEKQDRLGHI